jgi:A/G-specific adenine glycosylase
VSPYGILVAEMMLQRTGAAQVQRVYGPFLRKYPTLRRAVRSTSRSLAESLRPLGRVERYKQFRRAFKYLAQEHAERIPATFEELSRIPAVGPYTARSVLCFGYDRPVGLLDPGIYRLLQRVFEVRSERPRYNTDPKLWDLVDRLVPRAKAQEFNWALLDLAATVCRKRSPRCESCPVFRICLRERRSRREAI